MSTREIQLEEIAILAYQLWEDRGRPVGSPEVDWERAEKALHHQAASQENERISIASASPKPRRSRAAEDPTGRGNPAAGTPEIPGRTLR